MDSEGRALKTAAEAGDFAAIPARAAAYRRGIVETLLATSDARNRRAVLQQARETLHYAVQLAKTRRAHMAARLEEAESQGARYRLSEHHLHTWKIEG
jgi:hypothetical protein